MSVAIQDSPPMGNSPARARARESLWRLTALALAHPDPEFHDAIVAGKFQAAFSSAWTDVWGRPWSAPDCASDFATFEAGYIKAFLHGRAGKPAAALLAGDHEHLLAGLTRPVFMLNLTAFYKHFGLQAAACDEGRADEPDHVAGMSEFMAVLCHLEARALERSADASGYRRAQRDFLCRYLGPALETVSGLLNGAGIAELDPTLSRILQDMSDFAQHQISELEARVGPFRDPDAPGRRPTAEPVAQDLWG